MGKPFCENRGRSVETPYCGICGQRKPDALSLADLFRGALARILELQGGIRDLRLA